MSWYTTTLGHDLGHLGFLPLLHLAHINAMLKTRSIACRPSSTRLVIANSLFTSHRRAPFALSRSILLHSRHEHQSATIASGSPQPLALRHSYQGLIRPRRSGYTPVLPMALPAMIVEPAVDASVASASASPSLWRVLAIFTGLPIALWAYKCLMMVLFQRKIIYMGYIPPGSRTESLKDVPRSHIRGLDVREVCVKGETQALHGIIASRAGSSAENASSVVLYFQGNAGNTLHRLPVFQSFFADKQPVSKLSRDASTIGCNPHVVSIAPRTYWRSTGSPNRPTQPTLTSDYLLALHHTLSTYPGVPVIVYGHSLGASIALCLLASLRLDDNPEYNRIQGLIVENPFAGIAGMVEALYPERWVPYRYLTRFVWDRWDTLSALRSSVNPQTVLGRLKPDMLVLVSELDEVVPKTMGEEISRYACAEECGAVSTHSDRLGGLKVIQGALHENAWTTAQWKREMGRYIREVERRSA